MGGAWPGGALGNHRRGDDRGRGILAALAQQGPVDGAGLRVAPALLIAPDGGLGHGPACPVERPRVAADGVPTAISMGNAGSKLAVRRGAGGAGGASKMNQAGHMETPIPPAVPSASLNR